ncbi:MAG: Tfp pilus assembly protein FimT/FimU [Isosphaeraceae bacterium]
MNHPENRRPVPRRGVTLVEMLVTVAVLVIMMTILVQIFQAATGAVTAAQQLQQIDDQLRRLDSVIRGDLEGVTARFTPPLDPTQGLGYFEYGENEYADNQGEDSDDYIRFTAKAPEGRPFTGRIWINYWNSATTGQTFTVNSNPNITPNNSSSFPLTITSDYAEIIYFLRNGNLYRRVLLVAPELQSSIVPMIANTAYSQIDLSNANISTFMPAQFGGINGNISVSWQGVNDLSAHPAPTGPNANAIPTHQAQALSTIVLNTLGMLTNRENRFAYSRFANDFYDVNTTAYGKPDGIPDDVNQDNIPDLYTSLYPTIFSPTNYSGASVGVNQLIFAPASSTNTTGNTQLLLNPGVSYLAFPYMFPGAYSKAQALSTDAYGWIHAPSPYGNSAGTAVQFDTGGLAYLNGMNHNPVDLGDNLATPANPAITQGGVTEQNLLQTWWGFPTWRETLSFNWVDPTIQVNVGHALLQGGGNGTPSQPTALNPLTNGEVSGGILDNSGNTRLLLPAMDANWRLTPQPYTDSWGDNTNNLFANKVLSINTALWNSLSWEDDLIMTNVRSFDVKAYDNALGNYADLGWGDDLRMYLPYVNSGALINPTTTLPTALYLAGTNPLIAWPPVTTNTTFYSTINQTFAHEGRMPPLVEDNRLDAQNPNPNYTNYNNFTAQYSAFPNYSSNVGDDTAGIVRLRRVWDSWSTDYSRAPASGANLANGNFPSGPPFSPPIYPSYPAPYPAPLRGIQIQIRIADPTNQRIKSLTIREDFTDKL